MKRFSKMICIIFLCMLAGTLTVQAADDSFDAGAGITFEGSLPEETEKSTEKSTESTGTTGSSKPSLPQTGQAAGLVLPTVGIAVLILLLACWWMAVKYRGNSFAPRKESVPDNSRNTAQSNCM